MTNAFRAVRRKGFTLIELLVVIAIISILIALTVAGVMATLVRGVQMTARGDMNGFATAHGNFRQAFNVQFIPSRIRLQESGTYDTSDPIQARTVIFLQSMFGKRASLAQDWNNDGTITAYPTYIELAGEECLTFFLGGIPTRNGPNGCLGFSSDPINPAEVVSTQGRKGPYFDFKSARLIRAANGFFRYQDPFAGPGSAKAAYYVYLSANKAGNDYNGPRNGYLPATDPRNFSDSAQGVNPFVQSLSPLQYLNRDGFQIICAGRDGQFGPGDTSWSVTGGYGTSNAGSDDISNFSGAELRTGQQ